MSNRVVTGTLLALCGIGLAVAGIGWHGEDRPRPSSPERVYCDLNKLIKYHPAWDQYVQLNGLPSRLPSAGDSVRTGTMRLDVSGSPSDALPVNADRESLKARLEARTGEELSKIKDKLYCSLDQRVAQRRTELIGRADAEEADAKRNAEQSLTTELRMLDESTQHERVDAAIKLSALRAQLSVPGASRDRIRQAMAAREKALADARAKLARDEDGVRRKSAERLAAVHAERLSRIDSELSGLKAQESRGIDDRVRDAGVRLRVDLDDGLAAAFQNRKAAQAVRAGVGAGGGTGRVVSKAQSEYAEAAASVSGANASLRGGLRARMLAETRAHVGRIARENGLQITFTETSGVKDSTDWFKSRLPYSTSRRSG